MPLLIDILSSGRPVEPVRQIARASTTTIWVMGRPRPAPAAAPAEGEDIRASALANFVAFGTDGVAWTVAINDDVALALANLGDAATGFADGSASDSFTVPAGDGASIPFTVAAAQQQGAPLWVFKSDTGIVWVRVDSNGPDTRATFLSETLAYEEEPRSAPAIVVDDERRTIRIMTSRKGVETERVRPENAQRLLALLLLSDDPALGLDGGATILEEWDLLEVHARPNGARRLVAHHRNRRYAVDMERKSVLAVARGLEAIAGDQPFSIFDIDPVQQLVRDSSSAS
jgi:hypothetical protein